MGGKGGGVLRNEERIAGDKDRKRMMCSTMKGVVKCGDGAAARVQVQEFLACGLGSGRG